MAFCENTYLTKARTLVNLIDARLYRTSCGKNVKIIFIIFGLLPDLTAATRQKYLGGLINWARNRFMAVALKQNDKFAKSG